MKITHATLLTGLDGLREISALKLDIKTSFPLSKSLKKIQAAYTDYNEGLRSIAKDNEGDPAAIAAQSQALFNLEIDLDISPLHLVALEGRAVSAGALSALDWFIQE